MGINCIIVDDEPASREVLKKYVADSDSLQLVAECKNAIEAMVALKSGDVQLMFLDINMPKITGIQLMKSLTIPPRVIFTTAYPDFALQGFDLDAVDYLLKPFSFERFLKAVNKYALLAGNELLADSKVAFLKSEKKLYRVPMKEVVCLEAIGDYVKVTFGAQAIMVHSTFQDLLGQLAHPNLLRIHRSFAIAIDKMDYIDGNQIIIKGLTLPIGKAYRKEVLARLER